MFLAGPVLRNVLVVLLLGFSCGKRRCNYKEILESYREIILVELQNLNLSASSNTSKEKDPCPPGKAHRILSSIYVMIQQFRCQSHGQTYGDLEKPVESMEQLISHNCRDEGKRVSCQASKKMRGKKRKRKRNKLVKIIKALITCWEKLQSIYAFTKDKKAG